MITLSATCWCWLDVPWWYDTWSLWIYSISNRNVEWNLLYLLRTLSTTSVDANWTKAKCVVSDLFVGFRIPMILPNDAKWVFRSLWSMRFMMLVSADTRIVEVFTCFGCGCFFDRSFTSNSRVRLMFISTPLIICSSAKVLSTLFGESNETKAKFDPQRGREMSMTLPYEEKCCLRLALDTSPNDGVTSSVCDGLLSWRNDRFASSTSTRLWIEKDFTEIAGSFLINNLTFRWSCDSESSAAIHRRSNGMWQMRNRAHE